MCEMAPIGEMASERWHPSDRWHLGAEKEARKKYLIVFSHPHRRDGTGCDLNDVNPRVRATVPGPRGDIRAPLLSSTIASGTCVGSTLFTRGNESSCFHLMGMKSVRYQPSSQHTSGTCRLQPPRSQKVRPCVVFTYSASHPSERWHRGCLATVSYTHLTLPTICSV